MTDVWMQIDNRDDCPFICSDSDNGVLMADGAYGLYDDAVTYFYDNATYDCDYDAVSAAYSELENILIDIVRAHKVGDTGTFEWLGKTHSYRLTSKQTA